MDVYVMGIVYCPLSRFEQDVDLCSKCEHFAGVVPAAGARHREAVSRMYLDCRYEGRTRGIFKSSKSNRLATFISDDPPPPTPLEGEEWVRVSK